MYVCLYQCLNILRKSSCAWVESISRLMRFAHLRSKGTRDRTHGASHKILRFKTRRTGLRHNMSHVTGCHSINSEEGFTLVLGRPLSCR